MIVLFRNYSNAAEALAHLPLIPQGKYKLRSVLSGKDLGVFEHADWARGVQVAVATSASLKVLQVVPMSG